MRDCLFVNVGDRIHYENEVVTVLQIDTDGVHAYSEIQEQEIFITCNELLKYNEGKR
jgi:hypothetical protein